MEIKIPISKAQKDMEMRIQLIIKLFAELNENEQTKIVDYVITTYNRKEVKQ